MGGQIYPINSFITPCCFHLTLKYGIEQSGKMVNIKGQPHNHGWYSIWAYFILRCLELKLFCKWWGIVLMEQVRNEWALSSSYTILTAAQKNCWQHLLFTITLTRAYCVKSQLHRLMSHVPIDGPSTQVLHHGWATRQSAELIAPHQWLNFNASRRANTSIYRNVPKIAPCQLHDK